MIDILDDKIKNVVTSKKHSTKLLSNGLSDSYIATKRIFLLPIISLSPFIIAFIMLILYFGGVNEKGIQKEIQVTGTVDEIRINYNKNHKISGYEFKIIDDNKKYYNVPFSNQEVFNMFKEGDKVLIKAKKGSLGIIYDKWFYN